MLIFTSGMVAQEKIYNVQQYCVDNKPFTALGCDVSGNEYSFVFIDSAKKEVVLFLSDTKLSYELVKNDASAEIQKLTLRSVEGITEMTVSANETQIELVNPQRRIKLKVGKSTKMQ